MTWRGKALQVVCSYTTYQQRRASIGAVNHGLSLDVSSRNLPGIGLSMMRVERVKTI